MPLLLGLGRVSRLDLTVAGGKGANLGELSRAGLPVPPGFVVTTAAYDQFIAASGIGTEIVTAARAVTPHDSGSAGYAASVIAALFTRVDIGADLAGRIVKAYDHLTATGTRAVAVRSSATAEDLEEASFAGQQDTFLNVIGAHAVVSAVRDCWASLWTARAIAYRIDQGIDPADVSLAVVVQQLVAAESAGVMFTANPTNGRRDELVIAAAWGLGESVVGGSVSTDNLVVRRTGSTLRMITAEIADKHVQTVRTSHGTEERDVPAELRTAPVLTEREALDLVALGVRIHDHYDAPMDIEWARADGTFFIVQARPVTALPDAVGDPPTDWSVPRRTDMYARTSIVELLPDPLTPLFGDMIAPAVVTSIRELMRTALHADLRPDDVAFPLVNGYAYYAYRRLALLRVGTAATWALPKLFISDSPLAHWQQATHPRYQQIVAEHKTRASRERSATELLDDVADLLLEGCRYYTSVQAIIPLAATLELTFTNLYDKVLRRPGDPNGLTFLLGLDSEPMRAERDLYDLAMWCRDQPGLLTVLDTGPGDVDPVMWTAWQARLTGYLDRYGHTVYNLDFANPVAADSPAAIVETLRFYASGDGEDPRIRQHRLEAERRQAGDGLRRRLGPVRRAVIGRLLAGARRYGPIREDALADVGLAWPTVRARLRELGRRLVEAGALAVPDDVFWLRIDEARAYADSLDGGQSALEPIGTVPEERRMTWRGRRQVSPPQILPKNWTTTFGNASCRARPDREPTGRSSRDWRPAVARSPPRRC